MTDQEYFDRVAQARKRVRPATYVCYRTATPIVADGRLDAPWVEDRGWTAVIAFDYENMRANAPTANFPPKDGDVWRVNTSRLVRDRANTWTGKDWTWSRVGVYSMHIPELYGFVQFSDRIVGTARVPFTAETW